MVWREVTWRKTFRTGVDLEHSLGSVRNNDLLIEGKARSGSIRSNIS